MTNFKIVFGVHCGLRDPDTMSSPHLSPVALFFSKGSAYILTWYKENFIF